MLCIILEATLHEKHNGAGERREVKHAEPRVQVQGRSAHRTSARVLHTDAKHKKYKQGSDVVTHIYDSSTWRPA